MRRFLLTGLLSFILAPMTGFTIEPEVNFSTPKDPALVNHERIAYWLNKSGKLSNNATDSEKYSAVKSFVGPIHRNFSSQPEIVQKTIALQHQSYKHNRSRVYKNDQGKTVKVLAVLVDFPDLKHDAHGLSSADTDMYYQSYPVFHY